MKHALALALALTVAAPAAQAACYADYKARRDDPLQLHYGVIELRGPCERDAAEKEARSRLKAAGWKLLNVLAVFDEGGLNSRRGNAGDFFLRF